MMKSVWPGGGRFRLNVSVSSLRGYKETQNGLWWYLTLSFQIWGNSREKGKEIKATFYVRNSEISIIVFLMYCCFSIRSSSSLLIRKLIHPQSSPRTRLLCKLLHLFPGMVVQNLCILMSGGRHSVVLIVLHIFYRPERLGRFRRMVGVAVCECIFVWGCWCRVLVAWRHFLRGRGGGGFGFFSREEWWHLHKRLYRGRLIKRSEKAF